MARNQLPEGVGKKIVEALKRQSEAEVTPVQSLDNQITNNEIRLSSNIQLTNTQDTSEINFDSVDNSNFQVQNENFIVEEENNSAKTFDYSNIQEENFNLAPNEVQQEREIPVNTKPLTEETFIRTVKETVEKETPIFKMPKEAQTMTFNNMPQNIPAYTNNIPLREEQPKKTASMAPNINISIPANVAVLRNLIASLPVGVTKQTGAQIIRQTLEAMGLPMASVLKEAQEVQEELNTNTRECMLKIQEFKTNIMQLEQSVQEYQKNITQINDLVSLFLLTDRK